MSRTDYFKHAIKMLLKQIILKTRSFFEKQATLLDSSLLLWQHEVSLPTGMLLKLRWLWIVCVEEIMRDRR